MKLYPSTFISLLLLLSSPLFGQKEETSILFHREENGKYGWYENGDLICTDADDDGVCDNLDDCGGGLYGNDRYVTPENNNMIFDQVRTTQPINLPFHSKIDTITPKLPKTKVQRIALKAIHV